MTVKISQMTATEGVPDGLLAEVEDDGATRSLAIDLIRPVFAQAYAPDMVGTNPIVQDGLTTPEFGGAIFVVQSRSPVDAGWMWETRIIFNIDIKSVDTPGNAGQSIQVYPREMLVAAANNNPTIEARPEWWDDGIMGPVTGRAGGVPIRGAADRNDNVLRDALGTAVRFAVDAGDEFNGEWTLLVQDD